MEQIKDISKEAVLVKSEPVPEGTPTVQGLSIMFCLYV